MGASASDDRFSTQDEAGGSCPLLPYYSAVYIHTSSATAHGYAGLYSASEELRAVSVPSEVGH